MNEHRPTADVSHLAAFDIDGALREAADRINHGNRKSFLRNGEYLDQTLWTILDEDWRRAKSVWGGQVH